ncbi:hypothetical protein [Parageobacillus thermoglucosidasius]|uniref:Histidine kinase n=1 Tax=Parageobacillus thermoglucosidasius TaxID=1426 RepID=A0AAN0YRR7_PARTM|nr:hypothetical protein [Parageobacillus thermoglucosidasius]ANZ32242.1 histidine kinase [Parageobacillus thermoglucosidasius]APM82977.1 histidine kinase [Parageobacillus thermoglucosidasius]KJX67351.1 histidine kinase [Parageobacillus thermoglucosidasius]RDE18641.1 histidine kinase [Parageobacillus thermoglucosidasius]
MAPHVQTRTCAAFHRFFVRRAPRQVGLGRKGAGFGGPAAGWRGIPAASFILAIKSPKWRKTKSHLRWLNNSK